MNSLALAIGFGWALLSSDKPAESKQTLANPAINIEGHLDIAHAAAKHRESRRISEAEFIRMASEKGTVVLDARSKMKFDLLRIQGAVHLSFPDITIESLKQTIPDQSTRVLIYCNNNFKNAEAPFPSKLPTASLNISTYIALYNYGYRNVYELAPQIDPQDSRLVFEGSGARTK